MDYMKSSDKFKLELQIRLSRIGINLKKIDETINLLKNDAPDWMYKDLIDELLTTVSMDNQWICQNQMLLLLNCPIVWLKYYPKVLEFQKKLKDLGY